MAETKHLPGLVIETETETKTFIWGLMKSGPRPRLLNDFFETRNLGLIGTETSRDQERLGTEGLSTETARLWCLVSGVHLSGQPALVAAVPEEELLLQPLQGLTAGGGGSLVGG